MPRKPANPGGPIPDAPEVAANTSLNYRQRMFVNAFLGPANGNASEAARMAGYWGRSNTIGNRLLTNVDIRAAIAARLDSCALSTDEILARLSDMGSSDLADFVTVRQEAVTIDIPKAIGNGKSHLIRKLKSGKYGLEIELYDAKGALELLGKHRRLFGDDAQDEGEIEDETRSYFGKAPAPPGSADDARTPVARDSGRTKGKNS